MLGRSREVSPDAVEWRNVSGVREKIYLEGMGLIVMIQPNAQAYGPRQCKEHHST
jgi:F420-dependent methylenetetrahydromethanopterin dehydrogenase